MSINYPDIILELRDLVDYDRTTGNIIVSKDIFDDYIKDTVITIQFVEDDSKLINSYVMVRETEEEIYMELLTD